MKYNCYNLDADEDLEDALKKKRIITFGFFLIMFSIICFQAFYNDLKLKEEILNTKISEISMKDLKLKLENNTVDNSLIIILNKDNNVQSEVFEYIKEYFSGLSNAGNIYYYDESSDYIKSKNDDYKDTYINNKKELHYNNGITMYFLKEGKIIDKREFKVNELLNGLKGITKKERLLKQVLYTYKYLDINYKVTHGENIKDKTVQNILLMKLKHVKTCKT